MIRRYQEAPISKDIWRLGEWLHRNWRTRVVSRNSYPSGSPWWRRFPSRIVDVTRSKDKKVNYYKFWGCLSSISSLILINSVFACFINC